MNHIVFDCDGTLLDTSIPQYRLFPGIKELVEELAPGNMLYVWTARDRSSTLRILEELGIKRYFEAFATATDAPLKPHPGGLLQLLGKTPKEEILVIGDSGQDMLGAKHFGVRAFGAVWNKGTNPELLKEFGADFIVSHPSECSKLIRPKT